MPLKSKMNMKGFGEYLERIAQAGLDIDGICDEAMKVGAEIIQVEMDRRAPFLTGELRAHITIQGPYRDGNYHWAKVGVFEVNREQDMYFFYQEMGSAHNPAHPYIRPGWAVGNRLAKKAMLEVFKNSGAL